MEIVALFNLLASAVVVGIGGMVAASAALSPIRSRASRLAFAGVAIVGLPLSVFALAACFIYSIGV